MRVALSAWVAGGRSAAADGALEQDRADHRHDQGENRQGGADRPYYGEHDANHPDCAGDPADDHKTVGALLADPLWRIAAALLDIAHNL
jgi:hypothetical protein